LQIKSRKRKSKNSTGKEFWWCSSNKKQWRHSSQNCSTSTAENNWKWEEIVHLTNTTNRWQLWTLALFCYFARSFWLWRL